MIKSILIALCTVLLCWNSIPAEAQTPQDSVRFIGYLPVRHTDPTKWITRYQSEIDRYQTENQMLKDTVICDDRQETRTHKVFHCLEQICYELDLGNPIWLDTTVRDFKKHSKTRFYQDNFIEQIDFDYLEIQVIEEDGGE